MIDIRNEKIFDSVRYSFTSKWYSRCKIQTFCNRGARYSITKEDIDTIKEDIDNYFKALYKEMKIYQEPPQTENNPTDRMIRYLWGWGNNKKSDKWKVIKQIIAGEKYNKIATDNNITHQRVQQIAKSMWIKRNNRQKSIVLQ